MNKILNAPTINIIIICITFLISLILIFIWLWKRNLSIDTGKIKGQASLPYRRKTDTINIIEHHNIINRISDLYQEISKQTQIKKKKQHQIGYDIIRQISDYSINHFIKELKIYITGSQYNDKLAKKHKNKIIFLNYIKSNDEKIKECVDKLKMKNFSMTSFLYELERDSKGIDATRIRNDSDPVLYFTKTIKEIETMRLNTIDTDIEKNGLADYSQKDFEKAIEDKIRYYNNETERFMFFQYNENKCIMHPTYIKEVFEDAKLKIAEMLKDMFVEIRNVALMHDKKIKSFQNEIENIINLNNLEIKDGAEMQ